MTRCIRLGAAAVVVAGLTGLAGCNANSPAAAPAPSATGLSEAQIAAVLEEHAQCVRDHGIAGFQAPRVVDGRPQGKGEAPAGVDNETFLSALDACESITQRLPANLWRRPDPTAQELDKLRQFAACLRQHGYPDWPDPDSRGRFPILGTPMEEAVRKGDSEPQAFTACEQYRAPFGMTQP